MTPRDQTGTFNDDVYVPQGKNKDYPVFVQNARHNLKNDEDETEVINDIIENSIYREDPVD